MVDATGTQTTIPEAGTDGASDDGAGEKVFTEAELKAQIERAVKSRLSGATKAKAEAEAYKRQVEELTKQIEDKQTAGLSENEQLKRRLEKLEKDRDAQVNEWKAKAESESRARHEILVRHAIQSEINKRGLKEPELVEAYLSRSLTVATDGRVVRMSADGDEADISLVFDEFVKTHPTLVPAPAAGSGSRSGGPKGGRKSPGEMTGSELESAAEAELQAMRGGGRMASKPL